MRNNRGLVSASALAMTMVLAGCLGGTGDGTGLSTGVPTATQATERDVEAPEVFSKRDRALWDGRPSLGGVWVAHPDVRAPERVIIRNTDTGRETIGALFRRERMNPGPIFQVSADAAAAVGMLAGAPTGLEVIALRSEDISPAATADAAVVADAAPADAAPTAPETVAAAPMPAPEPSPATDTAIALPETGADAPAPRTGFFSRLFGGRAAPADTTEMAAIATETLPPPADAGTAPVSTAPLGAASGATSAPLPMPTPLPAAVTAATPTPVPVADAASTPAAPASSLSQPFIQLGIFSVEANATRAQILARDAGLTARVIKGQTQGNDFWRVTVGPATTSAEQRDLLARVKGLGFNDAYTVRR